jgi:hypothetical protein
MMVPQMILARIATALASSQRMKRMDWKTILTEIALGAGITIGYLTAILAIGYVILEGVK